MCDQRLDAVSDDPQGKGGGAIKLLTGFTPLARGLIVAAAVAIIVMFMQAAAPVIAPTLLAAFIAVVAAPPLRWLQGKGVPKWGGLALIVFVLLDFSSIAALVTTGALEGLRDSLPGYQERVMLLSDQLGDWLEGIGVEKAREAVPDIFDPAAATALVRLALTNVSDTFAIGLLVLLAVIFMLLEAPSLRVRLRTAFNLKDDSEMVLQRLLGATNRYMVIKISTSLATALCIWVLLKVLRIDFAILWAILAFLLNFIPFVGAFLMAIPAVLVALVQTDLQTTLLVALGYLVVNTVIGSILEPRIMGRGLGISTLAVFLSLLFWSWVLGTVGAFLAVPLTMVLMIALESSPQTRQVAYLLGAEAVPNAAADADTGASVAREDRHRQPPSPL